MFENKLNYLDESMETNEYEKKSFVIIFAEYTLGGRVMEEI
jgi:hypothetical protein